MHLRIARRASVSEKFSPMISSIYDLKFQISELLNKFARSSMGAVLSKLPQLLKEAVIQYVFHPDCQPTVEQCRANAKLWRTEPVAEEPRKSRVPLNGLGRRTAEMSDCMHVDSSPTWNPIYFDQF
jgi:hypothetical protein